MTNNKQNNKKDDERLDIKKLEELSPEERVRKLREIEERIKKELEELKKLREKTKKELEEEKKLINIIPQQEEINIEDLFRGTGEELEAEIDREAQRRPDYTTKLEEVKPKYLLEELEEMNKQRIETIGNLMRETYSIKNFVEETINKYNPSLGDKITEQLLFIQRELKKLYDARMPWEK